ncbi:ferredoxin C 1, chloroplastic [Malania oleifera]|uniref:ferredoxin C 1, chloroplastic n=1 Tax=Malania oleifera TaxID=397392 RepID=UPI0025AE5A39|nr:ferredoxin C 1, chloroplastic [Malania oleifera]
MAMATLPHFAASPSSPITLPLESKQRTPRLSPFPPIASRPHRLPRRRTAVGCSYKVVIEHEGRTTELAVEPDETILAKAVDAGLSVPHDCKLGVCMTCPARLLAGSVDQSEGMLSDDVVERGYALLCASYPRSDCHIRTIPEEELLSLQLATAND